MPRWLFAAVLASLLALAPVPAWSQETAADMPIADLHFHAGGNGQNSWLAALAMDMDQVIDKVEVIHIQRKNFTRPQTAKEHEI